MKLTDAERAARREYTRLRDIARKRAKRLDDEGLAHADDVLLEYDVRKLSEITDADGLEIALSGVKRFLRDRRSRIPGMRAAREEARKFQARWGGSDDDDDFTAENIDEFYQFMESLRAKYGESVGSPTVLRIWTRNTGSRDIDKLTREYDQWVEFVEKRGGELLDDLWREFAASI